MAFKNARAMAFSKSGGRATIFTAVKKILIFQTGGSSPEKFVGRGGLNVLLLPWAIKKVDCLVIVSTSILSYDSIDPHESIDVHSHNCGPQQIGLMLIVLDPLWILEAHTKAQTLFGVVWSSLVQGNHWIMFWTVVGTTKETP